MERDPMEMALSTDIVLDIVMIHLRVKDLLSCRLASKFWNKIASSVLRKRCSMIKKISTEEELIQLKECMEKSWDFPFAGLKFDHPWRLHSAGAMEFFQNYGARFTHLHLDTSWTMKLSFMAPFLNHLPRLSVLQLVCPLFKSPSANDSPVRLEDDKILDLSSVQTIKISPPCNIADANFVRELLAVASPLVKIECLNVTPDILRILKRARRLQAVTLIKFDKDRGRYMDYAYDLHREEMDQLSAELISLTKLYFTADKYLSMNGLMNILISSQHTLKELHLSGQCSSVCSWDNLPVLAKLTTFSSYTGSDFWTGEFFSGRQGHKFPVLKELKLSFTDKKAVNDFTDGSFVAPSVTRIDLAGYFDEDGMEELAEVFPKVIEIRLDYRYYSGDGASGLRNPFQIWSVREFKCLERLVIWNFDVKRPSKSYVHMDSFLTGMCVEICTNLLKEEKLNLINSPLNRILRVHPNVLQLPNLKELVVCVEAGYGFKKLPQDGTPFISMLSVWYALEMMPDVGVKFVYELSFSSRKNERNKAVLEAAFERVKDHVKLEPYFD